MTHIIVLFNLKPGVDVAAYENWARTSDMPAVRRLGSVKKFDVLRMERLLSGETNLPYDYAELIEIHGMDPFLEDVQTEAIQRAAKEFRSFADDPKFIVCTPLDDVKTVN